VTDRRPIRRLDDRLAGRTPDETLFEGVPDWLNIPLRGWLASIFAEGSKLMAERELAERVILLLRLHISEHQGGISGIAEQADLLLIADAALQLHYAWDLDRSRKYLGVGWDDLARKLDRLDGILTDGGSAYSVSREHRRLVLRVDGTVEAAAQSAIAAVPPTAADHLRQAWLATYGLGPDPDKAFHEAIRAVEEVACPLVQTRHAGNNLATLGTVLGELRGIGANRWELALQDKNGEPRGPEYVTIQVA
jgi:hypothetical protein